MDGRLTKIGEELVWDYDPDDFLAPWRLYTPASDKVDVVFTPFHERVDRTDTGLIVSDTHQCFGHYRGTVRTDDGTPPDRERPERLRRTGPHALVILGARTPHPVRAPACPWRAKATSTAALNTPG